MWMSAHPTRGHLGGKEEPGAKPSGKIINPIRWQIKTVMTLRWYGERVWPSNEKKQRKDDTEVKLKSTRTSAK